MSVIQENNILLIDDILEKNKLYSFYGANHRTFKLGSLVFEALEDEDDGYRSYLDSVPLVSHNETFSDTPFANVFYSTKNGLSDGFELRDKTGHVWLLVGTDSNDEYYPYFIFQFTPKLNIKSFANTNKDKFDPKSLHPEKLI